MDKKPEPDSASQYKYWASNWGILRDGKWRKKERRIFSVRIGILAVAPPLENLTTWPLTRNKKCTAPADTTGQNRPSAVESVKQMIIRKTPSGAFDSDVQPASKPRRIGRKDKLENDFGESHIPLPRFLAFCRHFLSVLNNGWSCQAAKLRMHAYVLAYLKYPRLGIWRISSSFGILTGSSQKATLRLVPEFL